MADHQIVLPRSVDTHCHLTRIPPDKLSDKNSLKELRRLGMEAVIDVGIRPADLDERVSAFGRFPMVHFASGLHPSEIEAADPFHQLKLLERQVSENRIVAVGEIGLDYHWDVGERSLARELFECQVAIAREADLPVIVHNREADADVLSVLGKHRPRGVMHCFSQDEEYAHRCIDLGLLISFGGNVTFKKADDLRCVARLVPDNFILVETDSPYLSPEPVRGRPNHPGHLGFTIQRLAELRRVHDVDFAELTGSNAINLFGLGLQD